MSLFKRWERWSTRVSNTLVGIIGVVCVVCGVSLRQLGGPAAAWVLFGVVGLALAVASLVSARRLR